MTKEQLTFAINQAVELYIANANRFDGNAQLRVNPASLGIDLVSGEDMLKAIAYADEAIEDAAASDGLANEDATDLQASQNPDFYPITTLISRADGAAKPDAKAIAAVVARYL